METKVAAKYATGFYNVIGELEFMTWELNAERAEQEFLEYISGKLQDDIHDINELLSLGWGVEILKVEPAPLKEQARVLIANRSESRNS